MNSNNNYSLVMSDDESRKAQRLVDFLCSNHVSLAEAVEAVTGEQLLGDCIEAVERLVIVVNYVK